jgi:hypothetical protein
MRIKKLFWEANGSEHQVELPADQVINIVVSENEMERQLFITGIEVSIFGFSEDPYASLIKTCSVSFDNEDKAGQMAKPVIDHQLFVERVCGQDPLDLVEYAAYGTYAKNFNGFLGRLSGGHLKGIRWDREVGMVVEQHNGKTRSVFALTRGEIQEIKCGAILSQIQLRLCPFHIIMADSLKLLDHELTNRFYSELLAALQPDSQVILVCRKLDVLCSPLVTFHSGPIIDLDDKE